MPAVPASDAQKAVNRNATTKVGLELVAGGFRGYPLDQRRVTLAEERELMAFASERLAQGTSVCLRSALERPPRPWPEQVLPYGLAEIMMITPSRWTLTEVSREVRLPV